MLLLMLAISLSFKLHCSTVCLTIHFLKRMKPVRKGDLVLAPDSLRLKTYPLEVSEVINCMLFLYLDFIS